MPTKNQLENLSELKKLRRSQLIHTLFMCLFLISISVVAGAFFYLNFTAERVEYSFSIPQIAGSNCFTASLNPFIGNDFHTFPYSYNDTAVNGTQITLIMNYYLKETPQPSYSINGTNISRPEATPTYTPIKEGVVYTFIVNREGEK